MTAQQIIGLKMGIMVLFFVFVIGVVWAGGNGKPQHNGHNGVPDIIRKDQKEQEFKENARPMIYPTARQAHQCFSFCRYIAMDAGQITYQGGFWACECAWGFDG